MDRSSNRQSVRNYGGRLQVQALPVQLSPGIVVRTLLGDSSSARKGWIMPKDAVMTDSDSDPDDAARAAGVDQIVEAADDE